jgi:phospholipase/carboxylesterase
MLRVQAAVLGGLECRVVENSSSTARPDAVAVFCHGFGAPGEDLVPVAWELAEFLGPVAERVRFVFPAGPLTMDEYGIPGGRAWWPIDMLKLQAAIEQGEFRDLRRDTPELLPEMRGRLMRLVEEIQHETGLPPARIVLGGFSQGSMLATDVALRLPAAPGGLIVWSGTLLCEDEWRALAAHRAGMPIVQSHGYEDPILPFAAAEWLRDMLTSAGATVQFLPFHGYHQIPRVALEKGAELIAAVANANQAAFFGNARA